ncbi:hypothetical protein DFJ74DRAFT_669995 [Hyaloraphidium curvatum]|nr:hypothetical protein DFJ74DRAFT_669995 [Hyaloraphidium curvatum]
MVPIAGCRAAWTRTIGIGIRAPLSSHALWSASFGPRRWQSGRPMRHAHVADIPIIEPYDPKARFSSGLLSFVKANLRNMSQGFMVWRNSTKSKRTLRETVHTLYVQMNEAFARKDEKALKAVVTDGFYGELVKELRKPRPKQIWSNEWSRGIFDRTHLVQVRLAQAQGDAKYAQLTYRLTSKQTVKVEGSDKVVAQIDRVREYIVISAILKGAETEWKICGKLPA